MAKRVRVKINPKGVIELFKSPAMNAYLQDVGDNIARSAEGMADDPDAEYSARAHNADFTAIVNVYPDTAAAARDNLKHNTLLKALGGSGLPSTKPTIK